MASFWRRRSTREQIRGYLFISPWLLGFLIFGLFPLAASFYLSLTSYDGSNRFPKVIGWLNYDTLLRSDPFFWISLKNTAFFAALQVPLMIAGGLTVAMLLYRNIKGVRFFRTAFYLPSVVSGIAVIMLWIWIFQPQYGLLNVALAKIGVQGPRWLMEPAWAKPALVLMSLWYVGGTMPVYLAGLKGIPTLLYEAATIDGAGPWQRFRHITLPGLSPTLFYFVITGTISAFQAFTEAYIMTGGGPSYSTLFYALRLFNLAFHDGRWGYASAMAWLLALLVMILTALNFWGAKHWVYYEGDLKR